MLQILNFLQENEGFLYLFLALLSIRYVVLVFRVQINLRKTIFLLERELLARRQNAALGMLLLLAVILMTVFVAVHIARPEVRRAEVLRVSSREAIEVTIVPTATPDIRFGVDVSGCANSGATITSPKPGDTISGLIDIFGSASLDQFAFYKIELSNPDSGEIWITLFTKNEPVIEKDGLLYQWDSTTVPPGVYFFRLSVYLRDGTVPNPCMVPIQVLDEK